MEPTDIQVGQRVRDIRRGNGTVVHIASPGSIGVDFDDMGNDRRHDCDGHARRGHGWYVNPHELRLIDDAGLDFSELFNLTDEPENREVKPLKLNELTQGLPLIGLRIMINPENNERYRDKYHGKTGTIVRLNGNSRDAYKNIVRYKRDGYAKGWNCRVQFDGGGECDIMIEHMLPVIPEKEVVIHEVYFSDSGEKFFWTPEKYDVNIDTYVIGYQWNVGKHVLWNDAERQKVLDANG